MISFIWPWLALLLPLPWIIRYFRPTKEQPTEIYIPSLPKHLSTTNKKQGYLLPILKTLAWISFLIALARPVWYGDPIQVSPEHRDMMLAVDLSGSMQVKDMKLPNGQMTDRLTAVKLVLADFIKEREGDRLGLVLFADHAYLQTPLTLDTQTVSQQLSRSVIGLIGQQTAIGEGLGIATKTFINSDAKQRVIVLLSDGSNTAGVLDPLAAADLAAKSGVTIYTVGIGADEMRQQGLLFDRTVNPSRDLDEKTLQAIADKTGGQYFRARDPEQLAKIYQAINELQPIKNAEKTWRPQQEWFNYPLAFSLLLSLFIFLLRRKHG
ncbi:VWA domain-containing protein [Vibrio sp. SS-MA-C1-2]|uniref:vWA domain-containing protein n=1 Tax=Vibrio sp. SS-MA-C1-2 TaxID=2908646 RepID=UPI001F2D7477|nr:VWA domain-containing protein [Vibrio sp. SS-MA-C1-2]UJF18584.1 VWA domain-containing protein [Vibrio sp. SS-MA-C1-2]